MVESRRKINEKIRKAKQKPIKWYAIRLVFWVLVLVVCIIMFLTGWIVGKVI